MNLGGLPTNPLGSLAVSRSASTDFSPEMKPSFNYILTPKCIKFQSQLLNFGCEKKEKGTLFPFLSRHLFNQESDWERPTTFERDNVKRANFLAFPISKIGNSTLLQTVSKAGRNESYLYASMDVVYFAHFYNLDFSDDHCKIESKLFLRYVTCLVT